MLTESQAQEALRGAAYDARTRLSLRRLRFEAALAGKGPLYGVRAVWL